MNLRLPVATFLIALPLAVGATPSSLLRFEFEEPHMGTTWRIVLYAPTADAANAASRSAFARVAELDARLSDYKADSELRTVESVAAGRAVAISSDLFYVLSSAQAFSTQTGGAFDVTVGALTRLWRRSRRLGILPSDEEIGRVRAVSGHDRLMLDAAERTVRLSQGVQLDLGGIAKGFAADEALGRLRMHGTTRALVAGGGDIAVGDPPPESTGWSVDITSWNDVSRSSLVLTRSGISTSGDTEQWLESGGIRYSHIVDPRTGRALTERRLVTVVAPNAITSDMLATAASVLAVPDAIRLAETTPGTAIRIETPARRGETHCVASEGWPHRSPGSTPGRDLAGSTCP